jgi:hypothetical protein
MDGSGNTCAVGAALLAFGVPPPFRLGSWEDAAAEPVKRFEDVTALHPIAKDESTVLKIIVSLNNYHGWTRSQIADWVATVEPNEPDQEQNEVRQVPIPSELTTTTAS